MWSKLLLILAIMEACGFSGENSFFYAVRRRPYSSVCTPSSCRQFVYTTAMHSFI